MEETEQSLPPESNSELEKGYTSSDQLAIALACLAAIMAIVLFFVEKTRWSIVLLLCVMVLCSIYPIFHFLKKRFARVVVFALFMITTMLFGYQQWPKKPEVATAVPVATPAPVPAPKLAPKPTTPKTHVPPQPAPITITGLTYANIRAVGDRAEMNVTAKNNTGSTLRIRSWGFGVFAPYYGESDRAAQFAAENTVWNYFQGSIDKKLIPQSLPISNPGTSFSVHTAPVTQEVLNQYAAGKRTSYLAAMVKDDHGRTLLEMCSYFDLNGKLINCLEHNSP